MENTTNIAPRIRHILRRFALPCLLAGAAFASPAPPAMIARIYVEPFITKAGGGQLRADLVAELRKIRSLSVAPDVSSASSILGGGGEIWIKGYRSLNPRSGRSPASGTPIYAGYLSIELRDSSGHTIWSYLATPPAGSDDVSRDLAKAIAKHVAEELARVQTPSADAPSAQTPVLLRAAGATFPYPVYAKWISNYHRENPAVRIDYAPDGSEAGVRDLLSGKVDFAASDSPQAIRDLAPADEGKYLLLPSVAGAVVPIVNLPGFTGDIQFSPAALAGIYLGTITKWNDPVLQQCNRGVRLPDLDIQVIHRADGSGTSYAWTEFLSKISPAWRNRVGAGLDPKWPAGRAASGNDGVSKLVKELGGAIGYVEFIYALQNHLSYGRVRNREGAFVAASLQSIAAAVSRSPAMGGDFKISLVDPPGAAVYPIASFTWFVVPRRFADIGKRDAITAFLEWMLNAGQKQAAALGYVALPGEIVAHELEAIATLR